MDPNLYAPPFIVNLSTLLCDINESIKQHLCVQECATVITLGCFTETKTSREVCTKYMYVEDREHIKPVKHK